MRPTLRTSIILILICLTSAAHAACDKPGDPGCNAAPVQAGDADKSKPHPGDKCSPEGAQTTGRWDAGAHWNHPGQESDTPLICKNGYWGLPFAP